jgi:hypothetical protein
VKISPDSVVVVRAIRLIYFGRCQGTNDRPADPHRASARNADRSFPCSLVDSHQSFGCGDPTSQVRCSSFHQTSSYFSAFLRSVVDSRETATSFALDRTLRLLSCSAQAKSLQTSACVSPLMPTSRYLDREGCSGDARFEHLGKKRRLRSNRRCQS